MIALDTNVLARHLLEDDVEQTGQVQEFLAGLTEDSPGFIPLTVMVELYWLLARAKQRPVSLVLAAFDGLMASAVLEIEDGESVGEALEAARRGADFPDALIAATARLYGVDETVTFDRRAAAQLGWRLLG